MSAPAAARLGAPVAAAQGVALLGAALVVVYTLLISSADAITKFIAGGYAAPQLFCLSGAIVMALSVLADRLRARPQGLRTACRGAMLARSVLTVIAACAFFYAFRLLPFAEVFLFIGLMPLLSGLMSGPLLGEHVRAPVWAALAAGFAGVLCLFPQGLAAVTSGHGVALLASVSGTASMVLARRIGRIERNALAQVFYPNLAIFLTMGAALPLVWRPMPAQDLAWVVVYAAVLFGARWLLVVALRLLPAYAVTPLMNLQFVWMVILGALVFGEVPGAHIYLGVAIVIGSGLFLIHDQFAAAPQGCAAGPGRARTPFASLRARGVPRP